MSQGRWVSGELVTSVYVVNQTSGGGGGGGGISSGDASGIASGVASGIVSGYIATGIASDVIPSQSGQYDLGSAAMPFKDGYFTSGSLYLADSHVFIDASQDLCITNTVHTGEPLTTSGQVSGMLAAPKASYDFVDARTSATVTLSVRDGGLIVTDPFTESVSNVDLGGTTPDPGTITNLSINGAGKYQAGQTGATPGANGLVTLEYINTPGQFFVISDIGGPGFGDRDRQCFGLVRETIYDATDLDGGPGVFAGGNAGGWSMSPFWYYTGTSPNNYPYIWTNYSVVAQTPGGAGNGPAGVFSGQASQKRWWDLCLKASVGHGYRIGIANGTLTQQDGADFNNRLVAQLLVTTEMLSHPDASTDLPASVITNGAGWYTCYASTGDFEDMGQFPDGNDKGYRFRWSTFGNTALNQLPYVQGVSNNDQITAAAGQSHYIVYNVNATDRDAANAILSSGTVTNNNRFYGAGVTAHVLQFNNPYAFPNTTADNVYDLNYSYVAAVQASPLFVTYDVSTASGIRESALSVAPLQRIHAQVCTEVVEAVTAYYLIRNFDTTNTAEAQALWATALSAALAGQIRNTYDAVFLMVPDDNTPSGTGGVVLFPQALKNEILDTLELWMNTTPDN